jgi:hypothetical protein
LHGSNGYWDFVIKVYWFGLVWFGFRERIFDVEHNIGALRIFDANRDFFIDPLVSQNEFKDFIAKLSPPQESFFTSYSVELRSILIGAPSCNIEPNQGRLANCFDPYSEWFRRKEEESPGCRTVIEHADSVQSFINMKGGNHPALVLWRMHRLGVSPEILNKYCDFGAEEEIEEIDEKVCFGKILEEITLSDFKEMVGVLTEGGLEKLVGDVCDDDLQGDPLGRDLLLSLICSAVEWSEGLSKVIGIGELPRIIGAASSEDALLRIFYVATGGIAEGSINPVPIQLFLSSLDNMQFKRLVAAATDDDLNRLVNEASGMQCLELLVLLSEAQLRVIRGDGSANETFITSERKERVKEAGFNGGIAGAFVGGAVAYAAKLAAFAFIASNPVGWAIGLAVFVGAVVGAVVGAGRMACKVGSAPCTFRRQSSLDRQQGGHALG